MKNIFMLIIFILISYSYLYSKSSYYKNTSNILERYPKVDIDYIFSQQESENTENIDKSPDSIKKSQINSPMSNPFQSTFYDYYQTSVPLYDEKMKCYFPIKKNISLDIDPEFNNVTKIKNVSEYLGKSFIKSLKGKCDKFYIERWYYKLCPFIGASQTLSYIKSDEKKKDEEIKQEINYLGYEVKKEFTHSNFLENLSGEFKEFAEKKYSDKIKDIKEENLFNMYGKKNGVIGIYKHIVNIYGETAFDSTLYPKYNKDLVIEYMIFKNNYKNKFFSENKTFKTNIIKVISNNLLLINQTIEKDELIAIKQLKKIKILKTDFIHNSTFFNSFFNQSFFLYKDYVYSESLSLVFCINMNCHITISNDMNVYKMDIIVDSKLAILENGIDIKKDIKNYENEKYCIFYGDEKLYFFGKGEIDELTETNDPSIFILVGENLNIENTEEILLLVNGTFTDTINYVFINNILNNIFNNQYLSLKYQERINQTHYKVKMTNKKDIIFFEKQITLDGRYIIVKNNPKKETKDEENKEAAKYILLGDEKNIKESKEKKEKIEKLKIEKSIEKYQEYKTPNNKEFVFNFELYTYNHYLKDSYITICFSSDKICKPEEDYEILIDIKNYGSLIQKINDNNNKNNSLVYSKINYQTIEDKIKLGIIYMNYTLYFNSIFKEEKSEEDSEIKLKYKIKNENYIINYVIINLNKSNNIYIDNMNFEKEVSFDLFKNIYFYEQKFLLDEKVLFIDTFENGDYCSPIKAPRRVIIYYTCDEEGIYDLKLTNVFEDKKHLCVYHYYAKSKYLCNPNIIMKNYLKSSKLKTLCYLDN